MMSMLANEHYCFKHGCGTYEQIATNRIGARVDDWAAERMIVAINDFRQDRAYPSILKILVIFHKYTLQNFLIMNHQYWSPSFIHSNQLIKVQLRMNICSIESREM